jgi:ATPase family associated with various cellular activities (AAA)
MQAANLSNMSTTHTIQLTGSQREALQELEFLYSVRLLTGHPTCGLLVGSKGFGCTTVVASLAEKHSLPVFTVYATSWVVRASRHTTYTLDALIAHLKELGPHVILLEHLDQVRIHENDGGWFHTVAQEIAQLIRAEFITQKAGPVAAGTYSASDAFQKSFIVLTATGTEGNIPWRTGETFHAADKLANSCIPQCLDELLPNPIFLSAPSEDEWREILRREIQCLDLYTGTLTDVRLQADAAQAASQPKGLRWLAEYKLKVLRDGGIPALQELIEAVQCVQTSVPQDESDVPTVPEPKLQLSQEVGSPVTVDDIIRYAEANPHIEDHIVSEVSDPFFSGQLPGGPAVLKIPLGFYGLTRNPATRSPESKERLRDYMQRLSEDLARQLKVSETISPELFQAVSALPLALTCLPSDVLIPASLISIIYEHRYYVYKDYQGNKDAHLLTLLTNCPEYLYRLLLSGSVKGVQSTRDLGCPYWTAKTLARRFTGQQFDHLVENILSLHDDNASYAHCYHWLKTRKATRSVSLDELRCNIYVISGSPPLAIQTALAYPELIPEIAQVVQETYSPLWIANWLRLVNGDATPKMIERLSTSAPWMVQFVLDVNPPDAEHLLNKIQAQVNPWWREWVGIFSEAWHARKPQTTAPSFPGKQLPCG